MEKRVAIWISLMLASAMLLAGCAQSSPPVICNPPYMNYKTGCCMDQNSNSICDDDEDVLFEPDYVQPELPYETIEYNDLSDVAYAEPEEIEEPATVAVEPEPEPEPEPKVTYTATKSSYTAAKTQLTGWEVENEMMSLKVTAIVIDVNSIVPENLVAPDKEAFLKEIHLEVTNNEYSYINPEFKFRFMDEKDPLIIRETLNCDATDDIPMIGCKNLPQHETMEIVMDIDVEIPRLDMEKTFKFTLTNKRDIKSANVLEFEKDADDILKIVGAEYI